MQQQETVTVESNGPTQSEQTHNSDSLIERVPIEKSPFTAVKQNDLWFITWGNYVLTPRMKEMEDCKQYMETNLWDVIAVYVISVVSESDKLKEQLANQQ